MTTDVPVDSVLNVETLGCFEVSLGHVVVVRRDDRNSKLSQLFAFFLYQRGRMIPQSEIISSVLQDDDNALNVLKNLVYRLRKLLASAGLSGDCILFKNSSYGFSRNVDCRCDFDELIALSKQARDKERPYADRMQAFRRISALYGGDFLQNSCSDPWALSAALRFQKIYEDCVIFAAESAAAEHDSAGVLEELRKAANLYVYNENINAAYITALYETKSVGEALRQYDKLSALLLDDFGVEPSEVVRRAYKRVLEGDDTAIESVSALRESIVEEDCFNGAYYCTQEVFKDIYRLSVRKAVRSGQSVFLMMCTVREKDGERPENGARMHEASEALSRSLRTCCRSGDVYTRVSPAQFVLMLTDITKENCNIVAERLRRYFYGLPKMKHTQLVCDYVSGIDIERLLK
ncbi:MAG: BTAD domain-containing putative transcriptional regulator [Oscillospiraceae bacterium]|nr:BTAD domain-containing putative transcriptional regulator [Oscillospiraceae bacterium]